MLLKVITTLDKPETIYTHVPYKVEEEERYYNLPDEEAIIVQRHPFVVSSENMVMLPSDSKSSPVVRTVLCGEMTVFIHENEHAYLMNDSGKTIKVIYRP